MLWVVMIGDDDDGGGGDDGDVDEGYDDHGMFNATIKTFTFIFQRYQNFCHQRNVITS